jgi:hypothetical protein
VDALIEMGGNVFFPEEPPQIKFHVSRGMGRVWFQRGASGGWFTPTHDMQDIVAPHFLGRDAHGFQCLLMAPVLALPSAARLLRSAEDIARVYADFPAQLAQAMKEFAVLLDAGVSGQPRLYRGKAEFSLVTETLNGQKVRCRQLLQIIKHTDYVRVRALQRLDDGRLLLHVMHETSPKRDRHVRWAEVDDHDAEACSIKRALLDAIGALHNGYKNHLPDR